MAFKLLSAILLIITLHPNTPEGHWLPLKPPQMGLPMPETESPKPLCASQMVLVNRACALVPYTPLHTPSPPSPSPEHHRHHHPRQGHVETPQEEECCRWLKEVDNECVCDLLVHLPPFLTRPVHGYKVVVDEDCEVNFECGSRF